MKKYYVNKNAQSTGEHEVHLYNDCPTPADSANRQDLGYHADCKSALRKAKDYYDNVDGCNNCIPACHSK